MQKWVRYIPKTISAQIRRVPGWFQDDVFRRLFLNASKLLSAKSIAGIISFVVSVMTARALGPENYGILALVLVYEMMFGALVSFKVWEAIIRFGSEALQVDDQAGLRQLIKFGFSLDIGSAIVGTILATVLSGPIIGLLGWDRSVRNLLVLYSILLLFSWSGTPVGVLRLFDRFDLLSYVAVLSSLSRLTGVIWCLLTGQRLFGFVLVYLITDIVSQLFQVFAALWVLRKKKIGSFARQPMQDLRSRFPGIWDFVWTTNLNSTIRLVSREVDSLIIAGLTTPATLGLFKVAKQISRILLMPVDPLSQSIYPELTRLWSNKKRVHFISVVKRATFFTSVVALIGWVGFLFLGRWIIEHSFGNAYQNAYGLTVIYLLAIVVYMIGFAVVPAMQAVGLVRQVFATNLIATFVYLVLLFLLVSQLGIVGAAVAYLGYFVVVSLMRMSYLLPCLRYTNRHLL